MVKLNKHFAIDTRQSSHIVYSGHFLKQRALNAVDAEIIRLSHPEENESEIHSITRPFYLHEARHTKRRLKLFQDDVYSKAIKIFEIQGKYPFKTNHNYTADISELLETLEEPEAILIYTEWEQKRDAQKATPRPHLNSNYG
ncbi:MAG: hypothetical protein JKY11_07070 [Alphaproteobacteria bacterium]|nr:hypothetical protein [Alphaproteobacteria bacterium]